LNFFADKNKKTESLVVREGDKPFLVLTLSDANLLKKVKFFASWQGTIAVEMVGEKLWVKPNQPLKTGRTRYSCTAYTGEKGRFYWYTQQWLATDKQSNWTYRD